jgi:hypothetical protein
MSNEINYEKKINSIESTVSLLKKLIEEIMIQNQETLQRNVDVKEIFQNFRDEVANKIQEIDATSIEDLKDELKKELNKNFDEKEKKVVIDNLDLISITKTVTNSVKNSLGNKSEEKEVVKTSIIKPILFSTIISSVVSILLILGGSKVINSNDKIEKEETIKYDKDTKFNCLIKKSGTFTSFVFESKDEVKGVKNIYGWENDKYICYYELGK